MNYDLNLGAHYKGIIIKELKDYIEVKVYKDSKYLLTILSTHKTIILNYFYKYDSIDNIKYSGKNSDVFLYLKDTNYELNICNLVISNNISLNIELKGDLKLHNVDLSSEDNILINLETQGSITSSKLFFTYGLFRIKSPNISINNSSLSFKSSSSLSRNLELNIGGNHVRENILTGILSIENVDELEIRYLPNVLDIKTNIVLTNSGILSVNSSFLKSLDNFTIPPDLLNDNIKRNFTSNLSVLLDELDIKNEYDYYRIISYYNKHEMGYVINNSSQYKYFDVLIYIDQYYNIQCKFIINSIVYSIQDFEENYKLKNQFDIKILKWIKLIGDIKSKLGLE